jgi:hypothetical protein
VSLPLLLGAIIAVLLAVIGAVALRRGDEAPRTAPVGRIVLLLMLALAGGWTLDYLARRDLAAQRQALEAHLFELTTRALMPGSALACLDAIAGAEIEEPCESAVFASPTATAAAVSYVGAQLALLSSAADHARRAGLAEGDAFAPLRRALEADPFGIVARVLAVRDGCSVDECDALALLHDRSRVSANLKERRFEMHLQRHLAAWPGAAHGAVAGDPASSGSAAVSAVAGPRRPNNLFFPSASSIPPVSIMTAEPASPRPPAAEPNGSTAPAASPRRAAPSAQTRQPAPQPAAPPGPTRLTPPDIQ